MKDIQEIKKIYEAKFEKVGKKLVLTQDQDYDFTFRDFFLDDKVAIVAADSHLVSSFVTQNFKLDLTSDHLHGPYKKYSHAYPFNRWDGLDPNSLSVYLYCTDPFDKNFLNSLFDDGDGKPDCSNAKEMLKNFESAKMLLDAMVDHGVTDFPEGKARTEPLEFIDAGFEAVIGLQKEDDDEESVRINLETEFEGMRDNITNSYNETPKFNASIFSNDVARKKIVKPLLDLYKKSEEPTAIAPVLESLNHALEAMRFYVSEHERSCGGLAYMIEDFRHDFAKAYGAPNALAYQGVDIESGKLVEESVADAVFVLHKNMVKNQTPKSAIKEFENGVKLCTEALQGHVYQFELFDSDGAFIDAESCFIGKDCTANGLEEALKNALKEVLEANQTETAKP